GWIDYLKLQARRQNIFEGQMMQFNDSRSAGTGIVTEFTIKSNIDGTMIWDITDQFNPEVIRFVRSGQNITFRSATDSLRTFVAFTSDNIGTPEIKATAVPNQNLHGSEPADMVIITHTSFLNYARDLSEFHLTRSSITSLVATTLEIYNEFSGGVPDIAALRNFVRMKFLKQRGTAHPLRYLLLFGDGSFENKKLPPENPNFIPTWQTQNSNIYVSSFTSDDFFALLEDGEGEMTGTEDVGTGRLPVSDTTEAAIAVAKIKAYMTGYGDWNNVVCLVADDEDGNTHMSDAEGLAGMLADSVPWVNTDKIYFDAYKQVTSPTGQFYPEVTEAINTRVNEGALIFNYIGHGNETGLGHERVLTTSDIGQWKNGSKLPLFITATCEFSRFDDININSVTGEISEKSSAGEKILLAPGGGGIGLMSTTRLAYSAPNYTLNRNIIDVAFDMDQDGNALCLGDIIRLAKNRSGSNVNKRNFVLLGDPAVRLSWPWHGKVITDSINNTPASEGADTLKALSMITVKGHLEDNKGQACPDFNGIVASLIYSQPSEIETLANDGGEKMKFMRYDNILYKGETVAANGRFEFTFMVPREIDYTFGKGKIIYYAYEGERDFRGSLDDIIVGGFSGEVRPDTTGPAIKIFMNDTLFRDGGMTDRDPKLLAVISDAGGINASGAGIGHDLICWLDGDRSGYTSLNSFFENAPGSYSSGIVSYPFHSISAGRHTVTLKAWDNYNNSSEKSLSFRVEENGSFIINNLINYPNPFSEKTRITAGHNRPGNEIGVTVEIFSVEGKKIKVIKTISSTSGYLIDPVEWDGTAGNNRKVAEGIYPYRVTLRLSTGETASISGRLIIY
ncbi:MAG: type IX secretion system sortase PorU, partial [Bacteroidales bacterium]